MASSFLSLVDFLVMMLNVTTIQMCSVTCWPYKSVSVNVGPDSVIHTCAEQIRNLPDQNSPVNCSHKQAARLHRAKPVVLLVQYQSLAEDASTPWASVLLHLFVPGVNLSYWLVEKTFPLNQSVLGLLVLCSMYLCRKWYFFFCFSSAIVLFCNMFMASGIMTHVIIPLWAICLIIQHLYCVTLAMFLILSTINFCFEVFILVF